MSGQSSFKNSRKNDEEMRHRRRAGRVEIRKRERELESLKRRNVTQAVLEAALEAAPAKASAQFLQGIIDGIYGSDTELQIVSTSRLRRLLSKADQVEALVNAVLEIGLVPVLVKFLDRFEAPTLQFEAAWCLTNIASGEDHQTQVVVDAGAVPKFVHLVRAGTREVKEQALWALGNIAGDGVPLRDELLTLGLLPLIFDLLSPGASIACMRTCTWTLANLCRGRPPPPYERVRCILPYITHLAMCDDDQILIDSAWALSYLTDGDNAQIQDVIDSGIVGRLVELLSVGEHELQKPTLRALGNIVTGDAQQTQCVLDCNPVPVLHRLLRSSREYIRKECCWALSNMLAGTPEQIQLIVDEEIIPDLIILVSEGETKVRREAAWAITNMICGGSDEQVAYVIGQGCIPPLVSILDTKDTKLIQIVLDGIREVLRFGAMKSVDGANVCAQWVEESGGVERIELLQQHENSKIYDRAHDIIITYFSEDVTVSYDNSEPQIASDGSHYQFSAAESPQKFDL